MVNAGIGRAVNDRCRCWWLETEPIVTLNAVHFVAGRLHGLQRRYRQLGTDRIERRGHALCCGSCTMPAAAST
jgi:hypothetical protein